MDNQSFVYGQLSACLALVRPVGMTEGETMDWLAVAADAVGYIPAHILESGCRRARAKCTHHAQIVPTIIEETRADMDWHNRPKVPASLRLVPPVEPAVHVEIEPLPDPNTLMPNLRRMGLSKGWLVEQDGKLQWAEDSAA